MNNCHTVYRIHEIQERGKLIATTDYNSTDYFIYRGEPMGFQYEKLKMFADYLGVDLEINVATSLDDAFRNLEEGKSDLIAMGLTVTLDRSEKVDFTLPILTDPADARPAQTGELAQNEDLGRH